MLLVKLDHDVRPCPKRAPKGGQQGCRDTARDTNPRQPVRLRVLLGPGSELVMLVEALVNAGARLCKAGVRGSIPLVSTTLRPARTQMMICVVPLDSRVVVTRD
jgi:hypothetical protein